MNFMPATISEDGKHVIVNGDLTLPISINVPPREHGKDITLGIRPENIIPAKEDTQNPFALAIDFIEELGSDTLVYGYLEQSNVRLTARLPSKWHPQAGQKHASVFIRPNSLHLFNKETKQRIYSEESL